MTEIVRQDIDPTTGLAPPGAAQREQLAERHDTLQQQAEEMPVEHFTIQNPNVFAPERELQDLIQTRDALTVTNPQPGYAYSWVFTGLQGQMIWAKKAKQWETVQGNDPESREYLYNDTSRRIGDVMLMRLPLDLYLLEQQEAEKKTQKIEESITSDLYTLEAKSGGRFKVHADQETNPYLPEMKSGAQSHGAKQVAMKHLDGQIRRGTVPGVPVK